MKAVLIPSALALVFALGPTLAQTPNSASPVATSFGNTPAVWAAFVGGTFTLISIIAGFYVLGRQLNTQRQLLMQQLEGQKDNALVAKRHSSAVDMKAKMYEEVLAVTSKATSAANDLNIFVARYESDLTVALLQPLDSVEREKRARDYTQKKHELLSQLGEVSLLIGRWKIVDPRIELFDYAIALEKKQFELADMSFIFRVLHPLQHDISLRDIWSFPPRFNDAVTAHSVILGKTLQTISDYLQDFQIDMQNLLLGELFPNKAPRRDSGDLVISMDQYAELRERLTDNFKPRIDTLLQTGPIKQP